MSVKSRVFNIKNAVRGGAVFAERPEIARAAGYALYFALGFALTAARVFGVCAPFGIGIVAQAGAGLAGVFCLVGASAGYIILGGFDWGIKYVAASMLVFTAAFVFKDMRLYRTSWFMPVVTAIFTALTGALNSFAAETTVPAVIVLFTEVLLAGGSAYFFRCALDTREKFSETSRLRHTVSVLILTACVLMSVAGVTLMGVISIGRLLAVLIVMTAAFKGTLLFGCAAGAALGLAMDIATGGGVPFFTMAYAFSGLLSGSFSKHGRFVFTLSYILANAASVFWTWGGALRVEVMYEAFAASVVFMILPSTLLNYIGAIVEDGKQGTGESGLRKYCSRRVYRISEAFLDIFDTVRGTMEAEKNDNDIATVFDRAADAICAGCKNSHICWQSQYLDTLDAMNGATKAMTKRGKLSKEDLPAYFTEKCEAPDAFIAAVNGELRALMYRRQYKSRLSENRAAAYGQYEDMSRIMESVARELDSSGGPDTLAERRLLRCLHGLDIEAEVSVFRDGGNRLRAVIESGSIGRLTADEGYLDKLSAVLSVRLCRPAADDADEGRLVLTEAEPLAVSVGIAAMKKKGEPVSGDRGTYFKTDQGVLCVILSDGMGSGEEAAKESVAAVRILERFLRAGVDPASAMKILNSVMLLKNGEDWGYATVDLVCIDLFSGATSFYKYGAAPSYVRNGRLIRRVRGESLAAGISAGGGFAPDVVRMRLKPGSVALIASDGVLAEEEDSWLRALIASHDGRDTKALAREALQGAVKQYGCEDDMTVLAVYVDNRA